MHLINHLHYNMHTGIISFANRIVQNIKTNESKDLILKQLYSLYNIQIIQKQHHRLDEKNVRHVMTNFHLCSLRSNGNPYMIFFTLYNDIPIIYFIDKKIHPGYQKPRILIVRGLFSQELFQNTLIDGEMVKKNDGKWLFLMNDIISYEGNYLSNVPLTERLKILYQILDKQYVPDEVIDVCEYKIKNYYHVCKESIIELLNIREKLDYTCRGIYIWSSNMRYKNKLVNFNEDNIINVVRKVKDETKFQTLDECQSDDTKISANLNCKENENMSSKILWLTKTDNPDVYDLYDGENTMSAKKIGNALIPNLTTSKVIRENMKNKNAAALLKVECQFNDKFMKWFPVKVV
jgi:hypothetical protein